MNELPISELFSAYLDGELTADEQAGAEHLLATDPAARQLLDDLRAVGSTLQSLPQYKVGEDLSERVLDIAARRMLAASFDNQVDNQVAAGPAAAASFSTESAQANDESRRTVKPLWQELRWRGLFNRRALAWSGIAVAVAIFLQWTGQPKPANRTIAHVTHVEATAPSNPAPAGAAAADRLSKAASMTGKGDTGMAKADVAKDFESRQVVESQKEVKKLAEQSSAGAVAQQPARLTGPTIQTPQWHAKAATTAKLADQARELSAPEQLAMRSSADKKNVDRSDLGVHEVARNEAAASAPSAMPAKNDDKVAKSEAPGPLAGGAGKGTASETEESGKRKSREITRDGKRDSQLDLQGSPAPSVATVEKPADMPKAPTAAAIALKTGAAPEERRIAELNSQNSYSGGTSVGGGALALGTENNKAAVAETASPANRLVIRIDITRQAAVGHVFERLLAQAGLGSQALEAQQGMTRNNLARSGNYGPAGAVGGLQNGVKDVAAGGGGQLQQPSALQNGAEFGNGVSGGTISAYGLRGALAGQSQATQNSPVQANGNITANAAPGSVATQNANLQNTYSQNLTPNAVATQSVFANAPSNFDQRQYVAPPARVVEIDATSDQILKVLEGLRSDPDAFASVSLPGDEGRGGRAAANRRNSGGTASPTDAAAQNYNFVAPQDNNNAAPSYASSAAKQQDAAPALHAPAPTPHALQAGDHRTRVAFELRIVDNVYNGAPAAAAPNSQAVSGSNAALGVPAGTSGGLLAPASPAQTSPVPAAPAPAGKQ